jgi:antitoxin (DNA-binding transcriptional repressor) of toxin-antitoxin stability system
VVVESDLRVDDLRSGLGGYVQRTRAGESFRVRRRGRVVARLLPPEAKPPTDLG